MLCVRACASDMSVWSSDFSGSPMRDTAFLAGKYGLADTFAGPLELSPLPRTCMRTLSVLEQLLNLVF